METAIVMPLFVFLILGIIQLALMHQARSMTKYAAFKAVRAGILHNADKKAMELAALAVLLPVISEKSGGSQGAETVKSTRSASDYAKKMGDLKNNQFPENSGLKYAQVAICSPTSGEAGSQPGQGTNLFDYPETPNSLQKLKSKKLSIELTFNYRLFIPFVDRVIFYISRGQEAQHATLFKDVVRMNTTATGVTGPKDSPESIRKSLANQKVYVVPIRAKYALRMQSDFVTSNLSGQSECGN
ncbi:MAG: pilus assembly protein [Cystobacterineae bacterium]|nr:pilus assembly protein [Cystobacterineae bacterium]